MSHVRDDTGTRRGSRWAFRLVDIAGFPIRIHVTFVLFLAWVSLSNPGAFMVLALVLSVFACVLLHELGHAVMAKKFGILTSSITLYPIGGIAMLDGRPRPKQELYISLAGPAVNALLAALLFAFSVFTTGRLPRLDFALGEGSFVDSMFAANIALAVFNMIPAFPMDGGRVLRAWIGLHKSEVSATKTASAVGQFLALIFGGVGLLTGNASLILIAFFVFLAAGQEARASRLRALLQGHPMQEAMQTEFRTISSGESLEFAATIVLVGSQHDFPVVSGDDVLGVLTLSDIAQGLASEGPSGYVAGHMRRTVKTAHPNVPLEMAMDMFSKEDPSPIVVMDEGAPVGLVSQENLADFIMLQQARAAKAYVA